MTDNLPATVAQEYGTGLEDIEDDVTAIPRVQVNHRTGTFKDALTGEEFPVMYGIALGMVRQRVLWAPSDDGPEPGSKPQCKSQDGKTGYPNMGVGNEEDLFPWENAPGLDPNTAAKDEHGRIILDCTGCPFAEWGAKGKNGKSKPPPCKERHTYPIFYSTEPVEGYVEGAFLETGIVSFQGSGVGPSRKYLSGFVRGKRPLYSAVTEIRLDVNRRGSVEYSVPTFTKIGEVPEGDWELFARDLPGMREYLTRAPRADDDGKDPVKAGGMSAQQAEANVMAGVSDDDVVDAEVVSAPAAQPAPAMPARPPLTRPVTPVAAPAAPAPTPVVQTPAESVVNAPAASVPISGTAPEDPDELPF